MSKDLAEKFRECDHLVIALQSEDDGLGGRPELRIWLDFDGMDRHITFKIGEEWGGSARHVSLTEAETAELINNLQVAIETLHACLAENNGDDDDDDEPEPPEDEPKPPKPPPSDVPQPSV